MQARYYDPVIERFCSNYPIVFRVVYEVLFYAVILFRLWLGILFCKKEKLNI